MNIGEPDFSTRALLVEERFPCPDILRWNLERSGFVVERASNGDEALKRNERFRPHVMLLDWSLPALSGIEVCRRLRALPGTRDVGVIMTGRTGDRYSVGDRSADGRDRRAITDRPATHRTGARGPDDDRIRPAARDRERRLRAAAGISETGAGPLFRATLRAMGRQGRVAKIACSFRPWQRQHAQPKGVMIIAPHR